MADSSEGFGIGILIGAAAGLAIGILYAPRSGKETREMLMEKAEETEHRAERIIEEARERANKLIEEAKEKASELRKKEGAEEAS